MKLYKNVITSGFISLGWHYFLQFQSDKADILLRCTCVAHVISWMYVLFSISITPYRRMFGMHTWKVSEGAYAEFRKTKKELDKPIWPQTISFSVIVFCSFWEDISRASKCPCCACPLCGQFIFFLKNIGACAFIVYLTYLKYDIIEYEWHYFCETVFHH